jgi:hypothetical protein
MHLSLLHPLGTMSHKVNKGGLKKERTIKINIYESETILISNTADKETKILVKV